MSKKDNPTTPVLSTGFQQVQEGVETVDKWVLNAKPKSYLGTGKPIVDQSAAMMVEDTRSFVQGMEQVFMMAMSKATAMMLVESTMKTGAEAMGYIQEAMKFLPAYTVQMGESAAVVVNNWETVKDVKANWPASGLPVPKGTATAQTEVKGLQDLSIDLGDDPHFKHQDSD